MNVAITWPKSRHLFSYLGELDKARGVGRVICYRLPSKPKMDLVRKKCFMVWDGAVRGWNLIVDCKWMDDVVDPVSGLVMKPGWYLIRNPEWHQVDALPMTGFRGFRYVELS